MSRHAVLTQQVFPLFPFKYNKCSIYKASGSFIWREEGCLEFSYTYLLLGQQCDFKNLLSNPVDSFKRSYVNADESSFQLLISTPPYHSTWLFSVAMLGHWDLVLLEPNRNIQAETINLAEPIITIKRTSFALSCNVLLELTPWLPSSRPPLISLMSNFVSDQETSDYWGIRPFKSVDQFYELDKFIQL